MFVLIAFGKSSAASNAHKNCFKGTENSKYGIIYSLFFVPEVKVLVLKPLINNTVLGNLCCLIFVYSSGSYLTMFMSCLAVICMFCCFFFCNFRVCCVYLV